MLRGWTAPSAASSVDGYQRWPLMPWSIPSHVTAVGLMLLFSRFPPNSISVRHRQRKPQWNVKWLKLVKCIRLDF